MIGNVSGNNKLTIIALPFAGGTKYSYRELEKFVPENINWVTLSLPGRGDRFSENLLESIDAIVDDLFDTIKPIIKENEYVFYGHSMGTLVGYELTKKIKKLGLRQPNFLFFTGRGAPKHERFSVKKSTLPKDEFWKSVNEMGGLPKEILAVEDLLELYYPILKSDFKVLEDYVYVDQEDKLSIPIHVCLGTEEIGEGDSKTTIAQMKSWQEETTAPCTFELLKGDHFFILNHPKAIVQKILHALTTSKTIVD